MISDESQIIANLLRAEVPFFAGRLGSVEAELLEIYSRRLNLQSSRPSLKSLIRLRKESWVSAGIWPPTKSEINKFVQEYESALESVSVMCYWNDKHHLPKEKHIISSLCRFHHKASLEVLDISYLAKYAESPWTRELEGKNVLIISSFAELIIDQYKKIDSLHSLPVLPHFNLFTLKPPVSNGLAISLNSWSGQLKIFENRLENFLRHNNVDVALVSAGAYGLPISKYLFLQNIKSIYVGGSLQLYFGIWGSRWRTSELVQDLSTSKWVNPDSSTMTKGSRFVERSAYW
jgi:hypothetical protein